MPEDKELIRRALLGDSEAQKECTKKEIALPCPFCGGDVILRHSSSETPFSEIVDTFCVTCQKCGCNPFGFSKYNLFYTSEGIREAKALKQKLLDKWNTRPAPPVGRCDQCKYSRNPKESDRQKDFYRWDSEIFIICPDAIVCESNHISQLVYPNHFCSSFKPKEK